MKEMHDFLQYLELYYTVAQRPHMYPLVAQNSHVVHALGPMSIACYALPHTSA